MTYLKTDFSRPRKVWFKVPSTPKRPYRDGGPSPSLMRSIDAMLVNYSPWKMLFGVPVFVCLGLLQMDDHPRDGSTTTTSLDHGTSPELTSSLLRSATDFKRGGRQISTPAKLKQFARGRDLADYCNPLEKGARAGKKQNCRLEIKTYVVSFCSIKVPVR